MSKISEERNSEPTGGARLVASHKDLLVWQRSMDLVETVYRFTASFPATEQWGLISQMRRAAISVPSNIAEGYGRQATGEYRHHVSFARGSLLELETQILLARRLKYLQAVDAEPVLKEIDQISRMLATLVSKLS
jgi:four helix bundle protein